MCENDREDRKRVSACVRERERGQRVSACVRERERLVLLFKL